MGEAVLGDSGAIQGALLDVATNPLSLLPSRTVERAVLLGLESDPDRLADHFVRRLGADPAARSPVVWARKSRKGFRPVHQLNIYERVRLAALVDALGLDGRFGDRSDEAWQEFQAGGTEGDDHPYLLRTDIAAFYQYVGHSQLRAELDLVAESPGVSEELIRSLEADVGRNVGLPQNIHSSHVLADAYLGVAERELESKGIPVWRFSDDIVIAAESWREINEGLGCLVEVLGRLGLALNEDKTRFFQQDTYREWLSEPHRRLEAVDGASEIFALLSDYDPDDPPDPEERQIELMGHIAPITTMLELALRPQADTSPDRLDVATNRRLIRGALRALTIAGAEGATLLVKDILGREPQLTPQVGYYLQSIAKAMPDLVYEHVGRLLSDESVHLSDWQILWILQAAYQPTEPTSLGELAPAIRTAIDDADSVTRTRGLVVLAMAGEVEPKEIAESFGTAREQFRPDLVAAMAHRCGSPEDAAVLRLIDGDHLYELVALSVLEVA